MFRPPMQGYRPYPQAPPPPQQGPGFGQGVRQFIDAFRSEQAAKKDQARQLLEQHAQMLEAGIPVDKKKMAKWAREAGLHFDLDAPPPPPQQMPQAQAPGMPDPRMQQAAQLGMQQSMGGPQMAPPPPPPRQGGLRGFIGQLGQAMGAPPPPSQGQQMGLMKMLRDIEQSGQMSRDMQGKADEAKRMGMQAALTISQGLSAGKTMEDPEMVRAFAIASMLGGLPGGGGMGKGMEEMLSSGAAAQLFPGLVDKMKGEQAKEAHDKARQQFRQGVASRMDPEHAVSAEPWVLGDTDEAPTFATVDGEKLNKSVQALTAEYPAATPDKIKTAALMLFSKDADPADLSQAMKDLGESMTQTRLGMDKDRLTLSKRSDSRAAEQMGRTRKEDSESEELRMAVGQILQLSGGDPDVAYDNADRLSFAAFGGDRKKATYYAQEIKKALKQISKNPDFLEKLATQAGAAGARAVIED